MKAALAVAALALLLRAGDVLRQGTPAPLAGDAREYWAYASSVSSTGRYEGLGGTRGSRMPGYPLFLSSIHALAGPSIRAVQAAQCLLGTLTCLFIFWWAKSLLRPGWALACGLGGACYYDLIAPSSWVMTECLYSFLLAASLCVLALEGLSARRRAILGGLGLGLTCLVRPEILPCSLAILGGAPFMLKRFTRRDALWALAAFMAVGSLWVARNAVVFRRFVPVSTVGSYNLYLGLRLPLQHQPIELGPFHAAADGLDELGRDADYAGAYRELKETTPLARRMKAYLFNLLSVYYPFLPWYDWTYALLLPFWILGLWSARKRRELWPAAGIVAGLSLAFAFFAGPVSRYRFGFAPCLIVLAGAGIQGWQDKLQNPGRFRWATGAWAAANLAVWLGSETLRRWVLGLKAAFL